MAEAMLIVALLLAVLVALLAIPLSLSFSLTRLQALQGYVHFRWLFGLVNFRANLPTKKSATEAEQSSRKQKSHRASSNRNSRDLIAMLKQSAFRKHMMKFIKNLLRATHAQNLYLKLRIGLGDPADTGMLWAVMGPFSGMLRNLQSMRIDIEPEFIDEVIEVDSHGQFHLVPLQFIALMIGFILSPTTIRAWRSARR